jgi:hypothetical protein
MNQTKRLRIAVPALAATFIGSLSAATFIDFETLPGGGTPTDDAAFGLGDFYTIGTTNVYFGIDTNGDFVADQPVYFETRNPGSEVIYNANPPSAGNTPVINGYAGAETSPFDFDADLSGGSIGGDFFLAPGAEYVLSGSTNYGWLRRMNPTDFFVIEYDGTLPTAASGQIWDNDFNEEVTISAWDAGGFQIGGNLTIQNAGDSLNGRPSSFAFSGATPIKRILISSTNGAGAGPLGFDNFNATQADLFPEIPETSSLALGGILLAAGFRRRRKG